MTQSVSSLEDQVALAVSRLRAEVGDDEGKVAEAMARALCATDPEFRFGKRKTYNCCGKPKGCTNMNPGCAYLQHPYKRWVRGEITLVELQERILK